MSEPGPVGLLHIPKTAGTTLRRVLERQVRPRPTYEVYRGKEWEELSRISSEQRQRIGLFVGHMRFVSVAAFPPETRMVTVLRHPVDRVTSHYYWARAWPHVQFHDEAQELSLSRYVSSAVDRDLWNGQTYLLSSLPASHEPDAFTRSRPHGDLTEHHLAEAKRNLRERFVAVGVSEEFETSLAMILCRLGLSPCRYTDRNVTPDRRTRTTQDPAELEAVYEHNALDLRLYEYAVEMFQKQRDSLGTDLTDMVGAVRRRKGPVVRAMSRARHAAGKAKGRWRGRSL
jgi:Sulfotransferase family